MNIDPSHGPLFRVSVFVISLIGVAVILYTVQAGSLFPTSAPAGTLRTLDEVHGAINGTFDSSAYTANTAGSAIQIAKCVITKMQGGSC